MKATGLLNELKFEMIIDTGAGVSLIGGDIWKIISEKSPDIKPSFSEKRRIVVADNRFVMTGGR